MSPTWPLCFKYTGPVMGKGFMAYIELCGRVLAVQETEGVWFHGVTPAAMAVSAPTLAEAGPIHRDALTRVFIDFAQEAESFEDFEQRVQAFFDAGDHELAEWNEAVKRITDGNEAIPEGLPRRKDPYIGLKVTRRSLEQVTPADNALLHREQNPQLYAAAA